MSRFLLNGQDLYGNAPQTGDKVSVIDTEGIVGQAGSTTNSQALFDGVAGDLCDVRTDLSDLDDEKLDIADEQVLGAWNMLENKLTTQTLNGITATVLSNGAVRITTGSSAPTQATNFFIQTIPNGQNILSNLTVGKHYYLTGCPAGGDSQTYNIMMNHRDNSSGTVTYFNDKGSGLEIDYDGTWTCYQMAIQIWPAVGANFDKTFYPMISTKKGAPYVPYAMTNRELTNAISYTIANFPTATGSSYYLHKVGRLGILTMVAVLSGVVADTWTLIGTIASGARPKNAYFFAGISAGTNNAVQVLIETDGSVKISSHTGGNLNIRASATYVIA